VEHVMLYVIFMVCYVKINTSICLWPFLHVFLLKGETDLCADGPEDLTDVGNEMEKAAERTTEEVDKSKSQLLYNVWLPKIPKNDLGFNFFITKIDTLLNIVKA